MICPSLPANAAPSARRITPSSGHLDIPGGIGAGGLYLQFYRWFRGDVRSRRTERSVIIREGPWKWLMSMDIGSTPAWAFRQTPQPARLPERSKFWSVVLSFPFPPVFLTLASGINFPTFSSHEFNTFAPQLIYHHLIHVLDVPRRRWWCRPTARFNTRLPSIPRREDPHRRCHRVAGNHGYAPTM